MLRITIFGGVTYGKARVGHRCLNGQVGNVSFSNLRSLGVGLHPLKTNIGHATPQKLIVFRINQYYSNHPFFGVVLVSGIAP